jgi:hypothetical protein
LQFDLCPLWGLGGALSKRARGLQQPIDLSLNFTAEMISKRYYLTILSTPGTEDSWNMSPPITAMANCGDRGRDLDSGEYV